MGTKASNLREPGSCLNRALPDEPVFVLRAKDPLAAQTVRLWASMAEGQHEPDKVHEAMAWADWADKWRHEREPKVAAMRASEGQREGYAVEGPSLRNARASAGY